MTSPQVEFDKTVDDYMAFFDRAFWRAPELRRERIIGCVVVLVAMTAVFIVGCFVSEVLSSHFVVYLIAYAVIVFATSW